MQYLKRRLAGLLDGDGENRRADADDPEHDGSLGEKRRDETVFQCNRAVKRFSHDAPSLVETF
jgi:hypothetical protein